MGVREFRKVTPHNKSHSRDVLGKTVVPVAPPRASPGAWGKPRDWWDFKLRDWWVFMGFQARNLPYKSLSLFSTPVWHIFVLGPQILDKPHLPSRSADSPSFYPTRFPSCTKSMTCVNRIKPPALRTVNPREVTSDAPWKARGIITGRFYISQRRPRSLKTTFTHVPPHIF